MWNRKNRTSSRRHPSDAEVEGLIRRGLDGGDSVPVPKGVVIHEEKQGWNPYDSSGSSLGKKPHKSVPGSAKPGNPGEDPYNTADQGGGRHRRWWD